MRHPFHAICPYFAMFPEQFVRQQLLRFTSPGDMIFDPFCGRGTAVFESLLNGRRAAGGDVNRVAVCVSSAKATAPAFPELVSRVDALEESFGRDGTDRGSPGPFFDACFERETLAEILFLREKLDWRSRADDCFLAATMLGILHGESHRSAYCLSNRMPRTIGAKPDYSIRWWNERGLVPPRRPAFDTLRKALKFRYRMPPAPARGVVKEADARRAGSEFAEFAGQVKLVVTSPPYLDTTDYTEDQWLRLWFLGGPPHPTYRKNKDDRHTRPDGYWRFLRESWSGLAPLMADDGTIAIRIGGKLAKADLFENLTDGLRTAFGSRVVEPLHEGETSEIRPRETTAFRPAPAGKRVEHDFAYRVSRR